MSPKSGYWFSQKIFPKQRARAGRRLDENSPRSAGARRSVGSDSLDNRNPLAIDAAGPHLRQSMTAPAEAAPADPVARRRTFAIISHPDAGKTTLTEKLLLFGGAIQLAGAVKAKRRPRQTPLRLDGDRAASAASRSSPR